MENNRLVTHCIISYWLTLMFVNSEEIVDITRDHHGDFFTLSGKKCTEEMCQSQTKFSNLVPGFGCKCQCLPTHQVFREDTKQCVHHLTDCPLAEFVRSTTTERIPVVSLPKAGQLVHPGAHLTIFRTMNINDNQFVSCVVAQVNVMTSNGWQRLDAQFTVFDLYEDKNKTFLQWFGNDEIRSQLQQRIIIVQLNCSNSNKTTFKPESNHFLSCAAMRIGWVPGIPINIYSLSNENPSLSQIITDKDNSSGNQNFLIIGLSLGILGLMYVFSVMIYLRAKKEQFRKRRALSSNPSPDTNCTSLETDESSDENLKSNGNIINNREIKSRSKSSSIKIEINDNQKDTNAQKSNNSDFAENENISSSEVDRIQSSVTLHTKKENEINEMSTANDTGIKTCLQIDVGLLDPDSLASPAPPALEFLQRIREMISSAKNKIRNFRFKPTLLVIPEDDYFYHDSCAKNDKQSNSNNSCRTFSPIPPPRQSRTKRSSDTPTPERRFGNNYAANISSHKERLSEIIQKYEEELSDTAEVNQKVSWRNNEFDKVCASENKCVRSIDEQEQEIEKTVENKVTECKDNLNDLSEVKETIETNEDEQQINPKNEKDSESNAIENTICSKVEDAKSSDENSNEKIKNNVNRCEKISESCVIATTNLCDDIKHQISGGETTSDNNGEYSDDNGGHRLKRCSAAHKKNIYLKGKHKNSQNNESGENYTSLDSLSASSSCEMSTTSSTAICLCSSETVSINSDITEDSLEITNDCICRQTDINPLDECLKELENASIESCARSPFRVDRATKGLEQLERIKASKWTHVCLDHKSTPVNNWVIRSQLLADISRGISSTEPRSLDLVNRQRHINESLAADLMLGIKSKTAKKLNRRGKYKTIDDSVVLQKLPADYCRKSLSEDEMSQSHCREADARRARFTRHKESNFNRNCKQFISRKNIANGDIGSKSQVNVCSHRILNEETTRNRFKQNSKAYKASDSDYITKTSV